MFIEDIGFLSSIHCYLYISTVLFGAGRSENEARRRFWDRIATPRLLRESEPPDNFPIQQRQPIARVVELENLQTKLKLSKAECLKFKHYASRMLDTHTRLREELRTVQRDSGRQLRKQQSQLMGAVRRIHYLVQEKSKLQSKLDDRDRYLKKVEAQLLRQRQQLRSAASRANTPAASPRVSKTPSRQGAGTPAPRLAFGRHNPAATPARQTQGYSSRHKGTPGTQNTFRGTPNVAPSGVDQGRWRGSYVAKHGSSQRPSRAPADGGYASVLLTDHRQLGRTDGEEQQRSNHSATEHRQLAHHGAEEQAEEEEAEDGDEFERWLRANDPENYELLKDNNMLSPPKKKQGHETRKKPQQSGAFAETHKKQPQSQSLLRSSGSTALTTSTHSLDRQNEFYTRAKRPTRQEKSARLATEEEASEEEEDEECEKESAARTFQPGTRTDPAPTKPQVSSRMDAERQRLQSHQQRQRAQLQDLQDRMAHVQAQQNSLKDGFRSRDNTPKRGQRQAPQEAVRRQPQQQEQEPKPPVPVKDELSVEQAMAHSALIDELIGGDLDVKKIDGLTKRLQVCVAFIVLDSVMIACQLSQ